MRRHVLAVCITCSTVGAAAQEDGQMLAAEIRSLMTSAIDAPSGRASGVLDGALAKAIGAKFKASGPILIEISNLRRYSQPGCRRLNIRFRQARVDLPTDSAPHPQTIDFGINYCRDGSAPKSLK